MVDLAGAQCPDDWDGDSMVPWLDDASTTWKDFAVSEYYAHNIASGMAMLRQGDWKYIYHTRIDDQYGPERELFNLVDDPKEFSNLAGDPAQADRVAAMHAALVKELGREPDDIERQSRAEQEVGYADAAS